jgi:hypothetical protein
MLMLAVVNIAVTVSISLIVSLSQLNTPPHMDYPLPGSASVALWLPPSCKRDSHQECCRFALWQCAVLPDRHHVCTRATSSVPESDDNGDFSRPDDGVGGEEHNNFDAYATILVRDDSVLLPCRE